MNCGCTSLGLNTYVIPYNAYADDAQGTNFSLGTPLSTSKYIAWVSIDSTAGTPTAADFAGKYFALYGSLELIEVAATDTTVSTTATIISQFDTPINFWKTGDVVKLNYAFFTATPSAVSMLVSVYFLGYTFGVFDLSSFTSDQLYLDFTIKKTGNTTATAQFNTWFADVAGQPMGGTVATIGKSALDITGLTNTSVAASLIKVTATCVGTDALQRTFSEASLTRS